MRPGIVLILASQGLPPVQLCDLHADLAERNSLCGQHRADVIRLTRLLENHVNPGRSTSRPPRHNDVTMDLHKLAPGNTKLGCE